MKVFFLKEWKVKILYREGGKMSTKIGSTKVYFTGFPGAYGKDRGKTPKDRQAASFGCKFGLAILSSGVNKIGQNAASRKEEE
jgi:hypothetical protein